MVSVTWWHWTEVRNVGDVRWYFLVQFLPMALIPLLLLLFPARYNRTQDLLAVLGLYVMAKLLELLDANVFSAGRLVSGHTLKHLAAAFAVYWMLRMLAARKLVRPHASVAALGGFAIAASRMGPHSSEHEPRTT